MRDSIMADITFALLQAGDLSRATLLGIHLLAPNHCAVQTADALQFIQDITARNTSTPPNTRTNNISFGTAEGFTDRPAGQTRSKTARAFAGRESIIAPIKTINDENAVKTVI